MRKAMMSRPRFRTKKVLRVDPKQQDETVIRRRGAAVPPYTQVFHEFIPVLTKAALYRHRVYLISYIINNLKENDMEIMLDTVDLAKAWSMSRKYVFEAINFLIAEKVIAREGGKRKGRFVVAPKFLFRGNPQFFLKQKELDKIKWTDSPVEQKGDVIQPKKKKVTNP